MSKEIEIIAGTNRNDSLSIQMALYYSQILNDLNIKNHIIDLNDLPGDFVFSALYENAGQNKEFNEFRIRMTQAEKFVFIVPEYNGSFPGALKAFIDGLKFPDTFLNKKAAMLGLSSGVQGGGLALSHLTDILNYCGTHVYALKPKLARINEYFIDGKINNPLYEKLILDQARGFNLF